MPQPVSKLPLADWLQGTWSLETFTSMDDAGAVVDVMGPNVSGYISYASDGWMSVQIMAANRKLYDFPEISGGKDDQLIAAATSYFAYAGRYTIDPQAAIVIHHLQFSLLPNWVGGHQTRYIERASDTVLILSGDPAPLDGKQQVARLRWQRVRSIN
ncbi:MULTISPECIES: lipocalin-like domain-containing protein [Rhizobium/Agrobacterium group]|nr:MULTISPECIES: lipocalin-like domain-containing protein [Rhizobium/Agrobacterium group]